MVIVVTGPTHVETSALATALADRLCWPFVDEHTHGEGGSGFRPDENGSDALSHVSGHVQRLRDVTNRVCERRGSLILAASPLSVSDYVQLTDGLRNIRVVNLSAAGRADGDGGRAAGGQSGTPAPEPAIPSGDAFAHITLDSAADVDALVGHVRLAFGV